MRLPVIPVSCALVLCAALGTAAQTPALASLPYDHIHLNVPDQAKAVEWYQKNFGGKPTTEAAERLMFGSTRLIFLRNANAQPSAGSSIDHIGFSFADLDAKMKELETAGVKIVTPVRDVPNLFKLGFVEDPWGTKIEVVQDPALLGLHHIHLRAADPAEMFTWLLAKFGGERTKLKGQIDAVKYSAAGFSDMWVLVQRGESTPSEGHAIDHVGWRATNLDGKIAELKSQGVKVTTEPRPLTLADNTTIHFAYVEGPAGTKIELVQRPR
ncbi:MAG TPA: VOC family protein [Vicinamibacterales bacterium]|nr:VOC family protein [Vicinamibacterales bacterium]